MTRRPIGAPLFALTVLAVPASAQAATHVGAFAMTESSSCSGDCGSAVKENTPDFGGSFLFTGRYGDWGIFLEMGGNNQAPFAGLGGIRWVGPVRFMVGPYFTAHHAEYDFPGPFPKAKSSDQVTALGAEVAYKGVYLQYQRYSAKHRFHSSRPDPNNPGATLTRNAKASFDVNAFTLGYRYKLW
ncbi:MAG TPA: hypothetical protein VKA48_07755 [Gammaproteobacteria bacterium]|nr:hypothetical protein [Gammaproteobacteria bacterium]